ncbi:MAG: hypothetical protein ACRCX2_23065, partial [Paraclostridium sp.]
MEPQDTFIEVFFKISKLFSTISTVLKIIFPYVFFYNTTHVLLAEFMQLGLFERSMDIFLYFYKTVFFILTIMSPSNWRYYLVLLFLIHLACA